MSLGRFGGKTTDRFRLSGGGGGGLSLLERARDELKNSPEGEPASSAQIARETAGYGANLLRNGSVESWSAGTTSAPDGWTLTGAGATIARNTTSGQTQHGLASVSVTAALNTATDLAQTVILSATQNARFRGNRMTVSLLGYATVAGRVFLRLDDGVNTKDSEFHPGDSAFHLLVVSMDIDSAATKIEVSFEISSGASITGVFDAAKLEVGAEATAFSVNAMDLQLVPRLTSLATQITLAGSSPMAYSDMTSTSVANVILDGTQSALILFIGELGFSVGSGTQNTLFGLTRNGTTIRDDFIISIPKNASANDHGWILPFVHIDRKPAAGIYTYQMRWATDVDSALVTDRDLIVMTFPDL